MFRRRDGALLKNIPPLRRMMPHLMPGRNEAAVYFEQRVDVTRTLAFLEAENEGRDKDRVTFFNVVLAAMLRTFVERPELNRFVVGRRLYQRNQIAFSFAIKRAMQDGAELTTTKLDLSPEDDLHSIGARLRRDIKGGKGGEENTSDLEMRLLTKLPRILLALVVTCQRWLDYFGLLPYALYRRDPLYASMVFTHLGSVGLEAAYHHLYEYGNCPFFTAIGKIEKAVVPGPGDMPVVRDTVVLKYVFDERITDGLYCAKSLEVFKRYLEDPALLGPPRLSP